MYVGVQDRSHAEGSHQDSVRRTSTFATQPCWMAWRENQEHPKEIYGVDISPSLISTMTDAVLNVVQVWQVPAQLRLAYPLPRRLSYSDGSTNSRSYSTGESRWVDSA